MIASVLFGCALLGALELEEGFLNPPREAKPHTWYHMMNGNVTKEGITRDFEELAAAGIGGVQMFDAGCAIPAGSLKFNSPEWFDLLKHAASEAKRLGLEVCIPNCSGWSSSGGPWNPASNAMKKVVFTETRVKGGTAFSGKLAAPENPCGFYEDIAVLAVPVPPANRMAYGGQRFTRAVTDGVETVTVISDEEIEASGYSLRIDFKPVWNSRVHLALEISRDGKTFEPAGARTFELTQSGRGSRGYRFVPFERPMGLRGLRLKLRYENPLSMTRPVEAEATGLRLEKKIMLTSLDNKTFVFRGELEPSVAESSSEQVVQKERIVPLTDRLKADGSLAWTAPDASCEWALLRIGYAAMPIYNHPASTCGKGYEVDKLSAAAMDYHFEQYIGKLCRLLGPLAGGETGFNNILVDSYEVGCQNWTRGFETVFRARRGYDIVPYLPVFAGYVVDGVVASERVLADFRRVVADLFAENYAGALAKKCHQYGLRLSLEPYGSGPFDNLQYGRHADIPMGEFWSMSKHSGYWDQAGNSKYASYVGHVWGRTFIGAESFTANPTDSGAWLTTPELIKPIGDAAYADGVNRIIYHRFVHQPWSDDRYVPGLTMGQWGMHFDRHNTWWPYAKEFLRYQARCQFMLSRGEHVADVLFYCGDDAPNQGGNTDGIGSSPYSLPYGYDWDVCETEAYRLLKIENGKIVAPGGATYRKLIRPSELRTGVALDFEPDVRVISGGVKPKWDHRRTSEADIYFVCRNNVTNESFELSFRTSGRVPELWDAERGTITAPRAWRAEKGRTAVTIDFETCGSVFVVFKDRPSRNVRPFVTQTMREERRVEGPWDVSFAAKYEGAPKPRRFERLVSWTESDDPDLRYLSGAATYVKAVEIDPPKPGERIVLDLGTVRNFAEVTVNGKTFPVLWKPPYRVDITEALAGAQGTAHPTVDLAVKVTNLWPNRLIGDDALPADVEWKAPEGRYQPIKEIPQWVKDGQKSPTGRHTFTTWRFWKADDPLLPSGLLGPVRICRLSTRVAAPQWPEVTQTAKPWVYNWWMASAVDGKGLENQCAELEAAGFGGFHVIPIYGAKGYEKQWRTMLSPEWVEVWNLAVRTAHKHGLGVDLTMGSGWCFGGPWVTDADAASSGMKVKRAGPGGRGYMIDPFSPQAMSNHVAQFEAAFGRNGTAERPRAFYHDSYEYYGAKPKRGGDWDAQLLATFGVWTDWCRANGYLTRNEAHGSPVNWLDFYAIADVPETEMFGADCRDILISKFASSAAHVTGKRLVSSESCTWIGQHFGVPLAEYKRFIDRLFLSGVNHVFYHGCCYSPAEAPWPGWCFYASSEMNWRNPIWRDVKFLNAYIARCQAMFQSCEPDNDTLVYWPLEDFRRVSGGPTPMTVHTTEWFHGQPVGAVARRLAADGCAFDYVSDRQLQALDLHRYARIVVPPCESMPAATKAAIARFTGRSVRLEPFPSAGLCFTRMRRGDETVYFLANTNATKVVSAAKPSARGAMWWMDPMTGEVTPQNGPIELEPYESGFLVCGDGALAVVPHRDATDPRPPATAGAPSPLSISGPWTLTPVCGGPVLPSERMMEALSTWSRNADGSENPFSGTMRYSTTFELPSPPRTSTSTCLLDLGRVEQSARVRINGKDVGFAIMEPYRIRFDASILRIGRNEIEVEVTSVGQNRLRQLGKDGVKWAYFEDINMMDYRNLGKPGAGEMGFDAATLPLCDCGLFGPVSILPGA